MSDFLEFVINSSLEGIEIEKMAAFPSVFLNLNPSDRRNISMWYSVGPKSETNEIPIAKADKKPYKEQLLVYTVFTLSEKQQKDAAKDLRDAQNEIEDDPKYKELRGSNAGREYYDKTLEKAKIEIDKKYKPKEWPVAWGVGINFRINQDMFHYYYGGRRGRGSRQSSAPTTRKGLIDYIKEKKGKVYHITEDPEVQEKRQKRMKDRPISDDKGAIRNRAKTFGQQKLKQLDPLVKKYMAILKTKINNKLKEVEDGIKKGDFGEWTNMIPHIVSKSDIITVKALGQIYREVNSSYGASTKDELVQFVKQVNDLIRALK